VVENYGASRFGLAHSVQQTQDGGYVAAGWTESYRAGNTDVWALKLDANGNISGCQEDLIKKKGRTWPNPILPFFELIKTHNSDRTRLSMGLFHLEFNVLHHFSIGIFDFNLPVPF
jgi:hypothetical protein